jgi:diguanylate cyclase (GGDEF)-like protein
MSDKKTPASDPVLQKSPLFSGLSKLEFNTVSAFLDRFHVKKGEQVFKEGDNGEDMFIILSGAVSAFVEQSDGTQRWVFDIKPWEFFGEMSIIAHEPRSATLVTKMDTELMVLHGIDFYRIIFEHPMIGVKILKAIGSVQNQWLDQSSKSYSDLMRWGETARRRAITDELTGLYNRRFLEESIKGRFDQGSVGLRKMSLLMLDLDRVHAVNEQRGPRAGDQVIIAAAKVLRSHIRSGDIAARLSGDEFAVLLPDTDEEEAVQIAERVRGVVQETQVEVPRAPGSPETEYIKAQTSIGIAVAPTHAQTGESFVFAADSALRKAKDAGRNRVDVAG